MNSKLVEGMSGCSGSNKSAIYRQQALTNRLFSEMNKLKAQYNVLNATSQQNKILIGANKSGSRAAISDLNDKRKEKEKELDDLQNDPKNRVAGAPTVDINAESSSAKQFSKAMAASANQS